MRTYRKWLLAGLSVLGLVVATGAQAKWIKVQSDHFAIYSNISERETRIYAVNLEKYRYVLTTLFHVSPEVDAATPMTDIYLVENKYDWKDAVPEAPEGAVGISFNATEGQFIVMQDLTIGRGPPVKTIDDVVSNEGQIVVFHEYAHSFMAHNSEVKYPAWFVEGFADYYATTRIFNDQALVGMSENQRVGRLMNGGTGVKYSVILSSPGAIGTTVGASLQFYAQSWLLAHYVLSDEDRRHKFSAYVAAYDKGEDPVASFERIFGITMDQLPGVLNTYLNKEMKATTYQVNGMPTPQITVTPMPGSSNKLLPWKASVMTAHQPKNTVALLDNVRKEAAHYPNDPFALKVLARAENILGDPAKAVTALRDYTEAHPDDSEAWALLGEGYYLTGKRGQIPEGEKPGANPMDRARFALVRTYKLDPKNAVALYYLSLAQEDRPDFPNDTAVDAAMQAHNLAPQVASYSARAAVMLVKTDRLDEGAAMLAVVASNPHNPGLAKWATNVIDAINRGAPKEEILTLLNGPSAPKF
ncbi:MAG TPA: tetratricopeptide repeat protein [Asticcacaulis sp.]|nr:tetratricopeptide repeat protein [Asticcacaulis sp.]